MMFLKAFLTAGIACALGQIILDNTKLTPGHLTSLYTVLGALLSFLGLYDKLIKWAGAGATLIISNFGHLLYSSGLDGLRENGILGLISKMLSKSSVAIVSAVVIAAVLTLIFKPKN